MKNVFIVENVLYKTLCDCEITSYPISVKKLSNGLKVSLIQDDTKNGASLEFGGAKHYIRYNSNASRYDIVHEFARYIMIMNKKSDNDSTNLLTLSLLAPPDVTRRIHIKTIDDLSILFDIPAKYAKEYLSNISPIYERDYKSEHLNKLHLYFKANKRNINKINFNARLTNFMIVCMASFGDAHHIEKLKGARDRFKIHRQKSFADEFDEDKK